MGTTPIAARLGTMAVVGALLAGAPAAQEKVDVTGKWQLEVHTDVGGTTTPSVTLKQDGETLTGHYSSETLGGADVTGTVKGTTVTFSFTGNAAGMPIEVTYTGTVEGKDAMKGRISLGGLAEGTFTGKRI